ncbi:hypothetical protein ACWEP5_03320 [Nocardia niigatensis]
MGASFSTELLGWKPRKRNKLDWKWVPNSADTDNVTSLTLSAHVLERLGKSNPNLVAVEPVVPPENQGDYWRGGRSITWLSSCRCWIRTGTGGWLMVRAS